MSFHTQIEQQLAQDFSTKGETILVDYQDAVFYGRRLQAAEMSRLFGLAFHGIVNGVTGFFKSFNNAPIATVDNHIRQDIGLRPTNVGAAGTEGRGYM